MSSLSRLFLNSVQGYGKMYFLISFKHLSLLNFFPCSLVASLSHINIFPIISAQNCFEHCKHVQLFFCIRMGEVTYSVFPCTVTLSGKLSSWLVSPTAAWKNTDILSYTFFFLFCTLNRRALVHIFCTQYTLILSLKRNVL